MSSRELIESLRHAGEEKVRLVRQEAEREADALRAEISRKIGELRKHCDEKLIVETGEETRRALGEAGNRARALKLAAEKELSDRMYTIARSSLRRLRDAGYPAVFGKLVQELPSLAWRLVKVNPGDAGLARAYFPGAEIIPDEESAGGIDVALADGAVRVINTFEKRLERAWPELLPLLVHDVYHEVSDGSAAESG